VPVCEDVATLFRYLGTGAYIAHAPGIATRYRFPRQGGSISRAQSGSLDEYNRLRCVNERAGLQDAIAMAQARGMTNRERGREVLTRYLLRIGRTVAAEGSTQLGADQIRAAAAIDPHTFALYATAQERAIVNLQRAAS
jgi:hypothetical protein